MISRPTYIHALTSTCTRTTGAVSMADIEDRLRCPFCLEELAYLDNPKQLRCTHVCCLSCLEGHVKVGETGKHLIECPVCR